MKAVALGAGLILTVVALIWMTAGHRKAAATKG